MFTLESSKNATQYNMGPFNAHVIDDEVAAKSPGATYYNLLFANN